MEFLTLRGVLAECRALRGESLVAATPLDDPAGLSLHFAPSGHRLCIQPFAAPGLFLEAGAPGRRGVADWPAADRVAGAPAQLLSLLKVLNERFAGGRLVSADTAGMSRVALFELERRDRFGDATRLTLIVELIGSFGNVLLIDGTAAEGRILERLQADRRRVNPRALNRGATWQPPFARGADLLIDGPAAVLAALEAEPRPSDAAGWQVRLRDGVAGIGPALAREIVIAADDSTPPDGVDEAPRAEAYANHLLRELERRVAAADAALPDSSGDGAFPVSARVRATLLNPAAEGGGAAGRESAAGHSLQQAVNARHADAERRLARLRQELERRPDGAADRRKGEALLAYAHDVPRSASTVTLPVGEAAEPAVIALDPRRTAADNAAVYFREARKAERAAEELPARVHSAEAQLARLQAFRDRLTALPPGDAAGLAALAAEWHGDGPPAAGSAARRSLPGDGGGPPRGRRAEPAAAPLGGPASRGAPAPSAALQPRRYDLPGGWVILVGRSQAGNDYLTHALAAPHDLWFHAHGAAGSHVVLKGPDKKAQPDKSLILAAAGLAALNSKGRHAAKVPVIYAEKRHVRKPRGGKPGLAAVTHEKSIMVRPAEPAVREET